MSEPEPIYTTEHDIQTMLIEALIRSRALVMRINSGRSGRIAFNRWGTQETGWQTAGMADLLAIMPEGETWYIEVKKSGGKYSQEQELFKREVLYRGGIWLTAAQALEELEAKP